MSVKSKSPDRHIIDLRPWGYKGKRVRLPFEGTYEDALRYHNEVQAEFGREKTFLDRTVAVIAEEYLEWVQTHQAPKTHADKKKMLWGHLLPFFGPMKPHLLTRAMLDAYKKKRLSEPGRYRKTRAVNLELLCMGHMLKWGHSRGYCEEPPKADKVPHFKGLPDVLTREEVSRLLDNMDSSFYFALFSTLYYCGLRKDEAMGLTWGAVNLDAGYLRIRGKGNRERLAPIPGRLLEILAGYSRLAPGPLLPAGLVFPSPRGGSRLYDVKKAIKRAKDRAGINRRIHAHMLRHSYATHLLQLGEDIRLIQAGLGHQSITTTQIYTHVAFPSLRAAVERLGNVDKCGQTGMIVKKEGASQHSETPSFLGGPHRDRTCDPLIKSQLLYQLS